MAKASGSGRTRNFATVIYPDSAPENWQDILSDYRVPAFISPLHDSDVNPTGEIKKAHHHVMIIFDNVKTVEQAEDLFKSIGGVGVEKISSIRGYARYLCHLDNPEKAQYPPESVRALAGADYMATIGLASDKYKAINEMIEYCIENAIYSYAKLLNYCRNERYDWFRVLCDNGTMVMIEFLKSYRWSVKNDEFFDRDDED